MSRRKRGRPPAVQTAGGRFAQGIGGGVARWDLCCAGGGQDVTTLINPQPKICSGELLPVYVNWALSPV